MLRTVEGDTGECQAEYHARRTPDHNLPAPDLIDPRQSDQREDEIRPRNDQAYGRRLIEADFLEQGRRVIHERIESAKLLERLHPTADD